MKLLNLLYESDSIQFRRPSLKYELGSLAPHIDKETMNEHYNVHYKGYADKLNQAIVEDKIKINDSTVPSLILALRQANQYSDKFRNNGGGFLNHLLYFEQLSPTPSNVSGDISKMINSTFESFSQFKEQFTQAGLDLFGSGWVWLVINSSNELQIVTTPNQDNPYMKSSSVKVLLAMDVWEHAYYLKHQANRKQYISDFFKVVDWQVVNSRL